MGTTRPARRSWLAVHPEAGGEMIDGLASRAEAQRLANPHEALQAAQAMKEAALFRCDDLALAQALRLSGNILIHLNRYEDALKAYAEARNIQADRGTAEGEIEMARLAIGSIAALKNLGRYDEALDRAREIMPLLDRHEQIRYRAILELNVGSILRLTGRYDEALATYERGRQGFLQAGDALEAARAEVNLGRLLVNMERFSEAAGRFERARAVFEQAGKGLPAARVDLNLGSLYEGQGRYRLALQGYQRAAGAFAALGVEREEAVATLYTAFVTLALNLFPEALDAALRAEAVLAAPPLMPRYAALALVVQAAARRGLGDLQGAGRLYGRGRSMFVELGGGPELARIDLAQAGLLRQLGRPGPALQLALRAFEQFTDLDLPLARGQAMLDLAESHLALARLSSAIQWARPVIEDPQTGQFALLSWRANWILGQAAARQNQPDEALARYRAAIAQVESIQQDLLADDLQAGFLADKLIAYEGLVQLCLEMGLSGEAFEIVERARSSVLLDFLASGLRLQDQGGDKALLDQLLDLRAAWRKHYRLAAGVWSARGEDEAGADRSRQIAPGRAAWAALREAEARIQTVLRGAQMTGQPGVPSAGERFSLAQVQQNLDEDTRLLAYFSSGRRMMAFVVGPAGQPAPVDLGCSPAEIIETLGTLDMLLKATPGLPAGYASDVLLPQIDLHLQKLYQALIAPLARQIAGHPRLVIAPHGPLHGLPFHALRDGRRYLIETYEIQYLPGAALLPLCRERSAARRLADGPALVMGYSGQGRLPHALAETMAVASTLPGSLLFQEDQAVLGSLSAHAGRCSLLHLAAHAVFRGDNPLFSHLQLADGPLSGVDVYDLDLARTCLVTLSACETALGQPRAGDLVGLARAFFHAGAPALLASLWRVDDLSTARLMADFYRRLATGQGKAAALRSAQLALLASHPNPFYWAPFVLIGD